MSPTESPAIILVAPQMGENIGAAARAMLNFGLTDLRLVAPRDGWPNQAAIDMAAGALEKMPPPRLFGTLAEALKDCHYAYATTARPRDMVKPVHTPREAAQETAGRGGGKTAFVFGRERTGLENDEVALCHAIINIPANPDFSSLNLGQAVLLTAHEVFAARVDAGAAENPDLPAPHEKLEEFLQRLEQSLDEGQFFRAPELRPTMLRNIRAMFTRALLTEQEVRTLHGMISALSGKKTGEIEKANKKAAQ